MQSKMHLTIFVLFIEKHNNGIVHIKAIEKYTN